MSSDADLLRGASRRDAASVAALYDRHAGRMYAVALRVTGDAARAANVLEEVFASLCDGPVLFDGTGDASGWLLRLTRDRALSGQTQNAATPVDGMTLTPRALVEAAFFDGISVQEAAKRLQTTEETVRTKLKEGMAELRAQLR
jgi:DNA-directed RNA polymerase specialized sigma24 family protein